MRTKILSSTTYGPAGSRILLKALFDRAMPEPELTVLDFVVRPTTVLRPFHCFVPFAVPGEPAGWYVCTSCGECTRTSRNGACDGVSHDHRWTRMGNGIYACLNCQSATNAPAPPTTLYACVREGMWPCRPSPVEIVVDK